MGQHLNLFNKGLNSDYQIMYQPDGTYRYLKNCELISQDGNNYAIKDCLGNTVMFTINAPYSTVYTANQIEPTPLAFISFPDKLIVISTNYDGTNGTPYMEIGKLEYLPYGEGIKPYAKAGQYNAGYIPLYHSLDLNGDIRHRIEGFAFVENELINRIYWTDNNNEPRVFNVSDPQFTTYFGSGSIVNGDTYMVLEGAITYNGTAYGPGLVDGNIFTGTATTIYTNLTGTSPTPKVIKYYPYQLLTWTPDRALSGLNFESYGTGSVTCGDKVYFTRLTTSDNSYSTTWSYGSYPIHVGTQNDPIIAGIPAYHNFVGGGTSTETLNSNYSVKVTANNIDTNYGFIELACAEYDFSSQTIRQITVVAKETITGSTMVLEHTGNDNLGELTLGDITLFPASILKIKTLTTNKNYNLIGNIEERAELDIDLTGVTCASFEYPINVHGDPDSCTIGGLPYQGGYPASTTANPAANTITPWSRWYVTVGDLGANTVVYDGVNYVAGQVIVGTSADDTILFTGSGAVRPCVTRNRYTPIGTSDRVEDAIQLSTGFWTYKDPAVHSHCAGYWSGETYRFGILFYDLKGNPFYVRWIKDYTMPSLNSKGGSLIMDTDFGGTDIYSLNPSGVKLSNISIPASIIDQIKGFSVVRAVRDPIIVTQGLVSQVVHTNTSPDVLKPMSWNNIGSDYYLPVSQWYTFMCPDTLVGATLKASVGVVGDIMDEANWYEPILYSGEYERASGGQEQVYTKWNTYVATDGLDRSREITFYGDCDEAQTIVNLGTAGETFLNDGMRIAAAAGTSPNDGCISGGAYTLDDHEATGCKKSIFKLNSSFTFVSSGGVDYSAAGSGNARKIIMNYKKAGKTAGSLYGGSGDSAKANTNYISTGHFQPITAQVKSDTYDAGTDSYIFNDVEVFGGDCFTSLIDIGYALWNKNFAQKYSYAWFFPCECNANYDLRRGRKASNAGMYFTDSGDGPAGSETIVYLGPSNEVRLEEYSYNDGYSSENSAIIYPALPVNYVNANQFKQRIRYAGPKVFGETIDTFRTFATLDYKDMSGQNGKINNLKTKEDRTIVWQDLAVNTVPILERQLLSAGTGDQTTIGTGGVVDRFDVITSYFGNQHQWSVTETEYGFTWFDMHRKAFVVLGMDGTGLMEVSLVKGLQGFFSEAFLEAIGSNIVDTTNILNSPTFEETSDRPLTGVGIHGVYDPKNKMTYMFFKFLQRKVMTVNGVSRDVYKNADFTVGYLHTSLDNMFVGFYDWFPMIAHSHNQWVFSSNNPKNVSQFLAPADYAVTYAQGETLQGTNNAGQINNSEYIATTAVTVASNNNLPLGSSGATYWTKINARNQVWANNQPSQLGQTTAPDYLYNSFFGRVVDNVITVVVNPQTDGTSFNVTSATQVTPTNVNYTSVQTEGNNSQTAQDTGITSTNRNYRYVFDKIIFNYPRKSNGGRIFSNYLAVTFTKKNWSTNPTVVSKAVKVLQKLISTFTLHK